MWQTLEPHYCPLEIPYESPPAYSFWWPGSSLSAQSTKKMGSPVRREAGGELPQPPLLSWEDCHVIHTISQSVPESRTPGTPVSPAPSVTLCGFLLFQSHFSSQNKLLASNSFLRVYFWGTPTKNSPNEQNKLWCREKILGVQGLWWFAVLEIVSCRPDPHSRPRALTLPGNPEVGEAGVKPRVRRPGTFLFFLSMLFVTLPPPNTYMHLWSPENC